jgi:hypothetical protein
MAGGEKTGNINGFRHLARPARALMPGQSGQPMEGSESQ